MNNSKANKSRRWLVPYLGRKVRKLKDENKQLLSNITWQGRQIREISKKLANAEGDGEFFKGYNEKIFNDLIEAHKQIGALQYYLKTNGIAIPEHLK